MQKIIQKFETVDDEILTGENVICRLFEARDTEKLLPRLPADDVLNLVWGENAAAACRRYNLDGAVLEVCEDKPVKTQVKSFTAELGKKYFGLVCPATRHAAMLCSECEPDFLIFRANADNLDRLRELVPWYNSLFLIQSALDICADSVPCKELDTDFVIINASRGKDFG